MVDRQLSTMPQKKRTRTRKPKTKAQSSQKKSGAVTSSQIRSLQSKIDRMHVNTSPFAATGSILGKSLGGFLGRPELGSSLGGWLGSGVGKIFGSGAYKMSKNSVWSTAEQCPSMHSTSENIIVRHREYIGDVFSSTTFQNIEYPINPGLQTTFPFLSTIAANFQEFSFKGLVFEFRSTSADALNSTNTALGTVAMAVQYRAGATSFTNKQQVLNEMWAADSKPSESFFMPVECAPAECPMDIQYVRTGSVPSGEDIRFYDLGKLALSTVGSQAVANVGELWVTYEVALKKPILVGAIGSDVESALIPRVSCSNIVPFGVSSGPILNNSMGATVDGFKITLPIGFSGKILLSLFWFGSAGSWSRPPITAVNATLVNYNGAPTQESNPTTGSSTLYQAIYSIPDSNIVASFTAGVGSGLISTCSCDISIVQVDFDTVPT